MTATLRFETLHTRDQLRRLEAAWQPLRSSSPSPTDRHEWTLSYLETIGKSERLAIICAFSGERLEAVAPLSRPRRWMCGYEQIGVRFLGEPADLPFRNERALYALARELARRRIPVALPRLPSDSATTRALLEAYGQPRIVRRHESRRCPAVVLDPAGGDPRDLLSKRMRSDLRRAARRAEELGDVTFEVLSPTNREEFARAFDEAQEVEASSWKGRERTAMALDARERAFFSAYGPRVAARDALRIAFMRIDGVAVATQVAVEDRGRYWLLKIGYNEAFARCSPGQLMMLHCLEYATAEGLESVEFLGSDAPWTRRWTKTERAMTALAVYPARPHVVGAFLGDAGLRWSNVLASRGAALAARARSRVRTAFVKRSESEGSQQSGSS